ncbi:MAG TPA: hypothetical protein PKJ25_07110 [Smithellaceae bacterium]|nr:hypothetical protein [Smithellaceae bacterium]
MKKIALALVFLIIFPLLAMADFDLIGYRDKYKDYFEGATLEEVAQDAYRRGGFDQEHPDFDKWKKTAGIEKIIQEDTERRGLLNRNESQNDGNISNKWLIAGLIIAISAIIFVLVSVYLRNTERSSIQWRKYWIYIAAALVIIVIASFYRYEKEQVGERLIRYDRFTSRVEWKSVFSNNDKWRPLRFKNLQQAKVRFQKRDLEAAAEKAATSSDSQTEELERMNRNNEKLRREVQDMKDTLDRQEFERRFGGHP